MITTSISTGRVEMVISCEGCGKTAHVVWSEQSQVHWCEFGFGCNIDWCSHCGQKIPPLDAEIETVHTMDSD